MRRPWEERERVYLGTAGRPVWLEHSELRARGMGCEVEEVGRQKPTYVWLYRPW